MPISEQLRQIIRNAGISANALAKASGVPQPTITRFIAGADMKASTIDRLADHFELELTKKDRPTPNSPKGVKTALKPAKKPPARRERA